MPKINLTPDQATGATGIFWTHEQASGFVNGDDEKVMSDLDESVGELVGNGVEGPQFIIIQIGGDAPGDSVA